MNLMPQLELVVYTKSDMDYNNDVFIFYKSLNGEISIFNVKSDFRLQTIIGQEPKLPV